MLKFTLEEILECIKYNSKMLKPDLIQEVNNLYAITPQYLTKLNEVLKLPVYLQETQVSPDEYARLFNYSLALNLKVVETYEEEE